MVSTEIATLCRFVRAVCPGQPWDEFTTEAWELILPRDYAYEECRQAVIEIKRRRARNADPRQRVPFIDPEDVMAEVRRARADQADRERIRVLRDPARYRAEVDAADATLAARIEAHRSERAAIDAGCRSGRGHGEGDGAIVGQIVARTGRPGLALGTVPPPGYGDPS